MDQNDWAENLKTTFFLRLEPPKWGILKKLLESYSSMAVGKLLGLSWKWIGHWWLSWTSNPVWGAERRPRWVRFPCTSANRFNCRGYLWVRFRSNPPVCSVHLLGLCRGNKCFRLPFAPPSSYMGELPNSHGWALADESYVLHGILSGTSALETSPSTLQPLSHCDCPFAK